MNSLGTTVGYILRSFEVNNELPKAINRFGGQDENGILYIGKADLFTHRVGDLARCIDKNYSQRKHEAGVRYLTIPNISLRHPIDNLFVTIVPSKTPHELEKEYLAKYEALFSELPPLNRQG
ncbi:TPA: hypothetical protein I7247_21115 [Vibrio vulnificus]|nr:hypothetical protein [Vibrio vulnificus]HDY7603522.1 hypothetical protein [Vibrio vulnificus]